MNTMLLVFILVQLAYSAYAIDDNRPKIYWNLPTENCTNSEEQPLIELDNNYLAALEEFILERIPNIYFNGLAILDLEGFRPDWDLHWGVLNVYREKSVEHVMSRSENSALNVKEVENLARDEFNKAVRWIFTETIRLARSLRPFATWGYYYYPFMHLDKITREGKTSIVKYNDNLEWLWRESDALYPSFYFEDQIKEKELNFETVKVSMAEANRIAKKYHLPVYSYTKFEYDAYDEKRMFDYYDKADICSSIKTMADMGAEGIIIWGTKIRIDRRCTNIAQYVNGEFGKSVKTILDQHQKCREKRCNNHGRCILKDRHEEKSCIMLENESGHTRFNCICDSQYTGPFCTKHVNSIE